MNQISHAFGHSSSLAGIGRSGLWTVVTIVGLLAGSGTTTAAQEAAGTGAPTVWDGVYTLTQAARGSASFAASCVRCHGTTPGGDNEDGKSLTGDAFWQSYRESTVDALFTYVRDNMPNGEGGSLGQSTYLDLVAYILNRNGFPAGARELSAESAVGVQIIAESGPGELPSTTLARVVGCLTRGDDGSWRLTNATPPERIQRAAVGDSDATRPLGAREYALMFVLMPLQPYVGHRMSVSGLLMGDGGADGINVTSTTSVAASCQ